MPHWSYDIQSESGSSRERKDTMRNLFTARINIFLALLLAVLFAAAASAGTYLAVRGQADLAGKINIPASPSASGFDKELALEELAPILEARAYIQQRYVGDMEDYSAVQSAVEGMVAGLGDRWSYYVSPEEMDAYYENLNNSYVGIGVTVTSTEEGNLRVEKVSDGSGAADAGIQVGDEIIEVRGVPVSSQDQSYWVDVIRGEEGTSIQLTLRSENGETRTVEVERRTVATVIVTGEMIGDIGYIALENFNIGAADALIGMTREFIKAGATALVFDMRFNNGGRLSELVEILDYLLPEGEIFRCVSKAGEETVYTSDKSCVELPMAVLINDASYSAAEYFAAALQQYGVAVTVGTPTVGKGFAQNTFTLSDGSAIAISVLKYYTPNGESLAGVGLTPDHEIDLSDEDYAARYYGQLAKEDDEQLQKALEVVKAR